MQTNSSAVPAPDLDPTAPQQAPSGSAWLAVLSVALGAFALVTTEFLPVGLLPGIASELRVTEGMAGMMVTIPGLVATVAALAVPLAAGKSDRRYVIIGLMVLLAISNGIVALSSSFALTLFGRALLGIGVGGFWAVGGGLGPRLVPAMWAARATSLIFAGISLGTVAGVPAGALIGELVGWRVAFGAGAVLAVLGAAAMLALMPALPTAVAMKARDLPQLLRIKKARLGMLATALIFIGQFSAYTYITPFLGQVAGMSAKTISALLLTYGAAGFVGNLIGGWAVARSVRGALIATGLVLGLSSLVMPLFGANMVAATALMVIWGLAFGSMPISVQTWMFQAAPDAMESGGAVFVSTAQISLATGALVGGVSVDHLGIPSALVVGGLFAIAMALLIWRLGHDQPARLHAVG
jgi:predicted MFS family arabinose efflux permease